VNAGKFWASGKSHADSPVLSFGEFVAVVEE
jgi:hypothetical protein